MRSTATQPPQAPAPTVRPPGHRAARGLSLAGTWALLIGVCGGAGLFLLGRHTIALALAVPGLTAAAGLYTAAAVTALRARRRRVSPAVAIIPLAVAAVAAWYTLPLAGLSWLRLLVLPAILTAAWRAARAGLRGRGRRAVEHRITQVLSPVLAQSASQVEQVMGGITGVLHPGRATAPHYGVAPHAAWQFRATRWDGTRILGAELLLPVHKEIANPDFLAEIRRALARAGLENVQLSVDPLHDLIRMDFDPPPAPPVNEATRKQAAARRAATAIAQVLGQKDDQVAVEVLDWDEIAAAASDPAVATPLKCFLVTYRQTPKVTSSASQELLRAHMSLQLFGDDSALRAVWMLAVDQVMFTRRTEFPDRIVHRPVDIPALFGGKVVIPHCTTDDGNLAGWQWSDTDAPHELVSGPTGTGKSVDMRTVMIEAARQGADVRGLDPKRVEMRGLRGWPNITRIATRVPEMTAVIEDTFADMMDRYDQIERGEAAEEDFDWIGLFIDEHIMLTLLISDWWAAQPHAPGDPKEHPVFRKLVALLVLARGARIRVRIHSQRVDATLFNDRVLGGVRDNLAARVALGRQTQQSAQMMFGDANVGRDIPLGAVAQGTVLGPFGLVRAKMHWLPDPAKWDRLSAEDRQLLLDMLPPGSHWDGPEPWRPTAEDEAQVRPDPAGRLAFFVRTALRTREAYLTDAATGGPPAAGSDGAYYGWSLSAAGTPEHAGTWIGCAASTPDGPRVYLHPDRVLDAVIRLAGPLEIPFPYGRADLDLALHSSGMLRTEQADGKTRRTVRRQLPGNDLGLSDDRQRVWDLPAGNFIGDIFTGDGSADVPAVMPAMPAAADPAPGPGAPFAEACQLTEGTRIVVVDDAGRTVTATVLFTSQDGDGLVIDYEPEGSDDSGDGGGGGTVGSIRVQPQQHIRLAQPASGT